MTPDPLDRVLAGQAPPFALIHRSTADGGDRLDVLLGEVETCPELAAIPLPERSAGTGTGIGTGARHDVLALVPYRQIRERGYAGVDDGTPLLALRVSEQDTVPLTEALARLPRVPTELVDGRFVPDDETYAATVRDVLAHEIGTGQGANFVIRRTYRALIRDYTLRSALSFFRNLLETESGAYWTYLVHTGTRTLVGASPERHVSLQGGTAVMNPISGTYRYPPTGPALPGVLEFLADRKETDELYMVLDEELKMMARVCEAGGRVVGPFLKEMTRLAHTEYLIEGRSDRDPREILRETLLAPTVTGSPLESACRVIERYEPEGRGYYSGVLALIGRDEQDAPTLDSAIVIRTAEIDGGGRLGIGVGATLVRHSDPAAEAAETRVKAAGLLAALEGGRSSRYADHPHVRTALAERNTSIARFWLDGACPQMPRVPALDGAKVLVVDAEDSFTAMLGHQLASLGLSVTVRGFAEPHPFDGYDFVVLGPGPGDPRAVGEPKAARLRADIDTLLTERRPFLAVCFSHQVLCGRLGFDLFRRDVPNQGTQREIDLFGARESVGFYNTFETRWSEDKTECAGVGLVELSRDRETGEVYALRGPHFASVQFHAESVLTRDGVRILAELLTHVAEA
ncbi:anthranilate synthase family protein [Streptomyces aurantiacus]|uniref:anthranilate synthase n=1 Tax=Streptomyces aurantiacus TaxID=47760 RepID=A0A7G1P3B8_9ACTN|nr:anthranilate synthase family protein [Streptomyces aurantiacus]BCL27575.1 phenazine-specific anthranilate synthase component I [Streptomyces aurantiacus]